MFGLKLHVSVATKHSGGVRFRHPGGSELGVRVNFEGLGGVGSRGSCSRMCHQTAKPRRVKTER